MGWACAVLLASLILASLLGTPMCQSPENATSEEGAPKDTFPVAVDSFTLTEESTIGGTVTGFLDFTTNGKTYRVCTAFPDNHTADVFCKQFGHIGGGYRVTSPAVELLVNQVPKSRMRISGALPYLRCRPEVTALADCTSGEIIPEASCPVQDTVAFKCYGNNALRLVDGNATNAGRLQMLYNGTWYNTCSDRIINTTADVACRLLGFNNTRAIRVSSATFDPPGPGFDPAALPPAGPNAPAAAFPPGTPNRYREPQLFLPYPSCKGLEDSFSMCFKDAYIDIGGPDRYDCYTKGSDAALICEKPPPPPGEVRNGAGAAVQPAALVLLLVAALAVGLGLGEGLQ